MSNLQEEEKRATFRIKGIDYPLVELLESFSEQEKEKGLLTEKEHEKFITIIKSKTDDELEMFLINSLISHEIEKKEFHECIKEFIRDGYCSLEDVTNGQARNDCPLKHQACCS